MTLGLVPSEQAVARSALLIRSLCNPSIYDHTVNDLRTIETHISWIILTGPYAYKIKKPVSLSFLDFSTLPRRKKMCREELRLNRRLTPELYLGLVTITGTASNPILNGSDEIIEYAIKMVQFDTDKELDVLIKEKIDIHLIDDLALRVADFHQNHVRICGECEYSSPLLVSQRIKDNFVEIRPSLDPALRLKLGRLEEWVDNSCSTRRGVMDFRQRSGFVRECHGDLHLGNMVLIDGRIRLFDCLEFNEQFRWIDVMSEIAFVVMDFDYHGQRELGYQFLNAYLSKTGDYAGLELLPLYLVYRALVRAKVACIRNQQSVSKAGDLADVAGHIDLALTYISFPRAQLFITHGYSGSGKSWWSERIARLLPAIHIRSDVERNRTDAESVQSESGTHRYSSRNIARTYARLLKLAEIILSFGYSVIVDATFLQYKNRVQFYTLARKSGTMARILDFQCSEEKLRARIDRRLSLGQDPSEANIKVLDEQIKYTQPLREEELDRCIPVNTEVEVDTGMLVRRIVR